MNIDQLKEMGFNLIPLKPKSKEPIGGLNWKKYQEEKYTGDIPDSLNKGVVCGRTSGNIFVVDLDDVSLFEDYPEEMKKTKGNKNNLRAEIYSKGLDILNITEGFVKSEDTHYAFLKKILMMMKNGP